MQQILDFLLQHETIYQALLALALWFVFRSVPPSILADLRSKAAATETPIDDIIVMILERLNAQQPDTPVSIGNGGSWADGTLTLPDADDIPAAPQQPASSPPAAPPIPPEPIEPTPLPHATIPIVISGNLFKAPDGREVWQPVGFGEYVGIPYDAEGGIERVHPVADFGNWDGLRIHLDDTAGKFLFPLAEPVDFPIGVKFAAWLNFKLKAIPKPEVTSPIDHWLFWELLIDGELVDTVALHDGDTNVQFSFTGRGRPVTLGFRLRLDWANLTGSSELEWTEAGYGHTIGAGLT